MNGKVVTGSEPIAVDAMAATTREIGSRDSMFRASACLITVAWVSACRSPLIRPVVQRIRNL